MRALIVSLVERLDSAYRDQPHFTRLKARLLAAFALLLLVFVPLNLAKILWLQPPHLPLRVLFNLDFALAALLALHWVRRGRLTAAGNALVLVMVLPVHAIAAVATLPQPLSAALSMFIFNLIVLLLALVFASRGVAAAAFGVMVAGHLWLHARTLQGAPMAGTLEFAAGTLFREGLIAMGFVFCLGAMLMAMLEAANRRSAESLRETRALNANLESLVAERTQALEVATLRATEASRAKGDFLANMSHEIRTPLNGIIAAADLLRRRADLPPSATEHVRLIADSGDLLLKLLGDILDLSKIEAGRLALESHSFELATLARDALALVSPKAAETGVRLDFTAGPEVGGWFDGDSFRLRQILLNLLANAVKFTPAGGEVRLTLSSPTPGLVRFEVTDTGIGMDAKTLRHLFERFTQADSSTTRRFGGTGLGLAISARLVSLMNGRLEAKSVPGQGSTFHFTFPLPPTAAPGAAPVDPPSVAASGLHVLVAEDNAINRRILAAQLEKLGCTCAFAADGEEALAALEVAPALPDIVFMDCHMPNLDGWETTRRIRAAADDPAASERQRAASRLPIVALTAAVMPEERARCLEAGMNDFLAKPVKLADLQRALALAVPAA